MNYSERTKTYGRKIVKDKKSEYYKRLYISWGVCILIGLILGALVVGAITLIVNAEPKSESEPINVVDTPSYGTIDGKVFNSELSLNWVGAEANFTPLDVPLDKNLQEFIYYLSCGYNIEFPFVMAVIETESSFRPDAIGSGVDFGLMQINKINHEWLTETLGVTDFLDPYQNTRSGIFILRKLFEKYEDPSKVLMAYNMGETGASKLWEQGINSTKYSDAVLETALEYKEILERKGEQ